jgi:threonine dehydratase
MSRAGRRCAETKRRRACGQVRMFALLPADVLIAPNGTGLRVPAQLHPPISSGDLYEAQAVTTATAESTNFSPSRLRAIHRESAHLVCRTPMLSSRSLSEELGERVALKAENLQRTGSFKLRGALAKLSRPDPAQSPGVVAGSAGNHAQSVAYAARSRGLQCEIFMPTEASVSKLAAVRAFGATVKEAGASVDECIALAHERAHETGMTFVHLFDDPEIIEGQAGLGLELARDILRHDG